MLRRVAPPLVAVGAVAGVIVFGGSAANADPLFGQATPQSQAGRTDTPSILVPTDQPTRTLNPADICRMSQSVVLSPECKRILREEKSGGQDGSRGSDGSSGTPVTWSAPTVSETQPGQQVPVSQPDKQAPEPQPGKLVPVSQPEASPNQGCLAFLNMVVGIMPGPECQRVLQEYRRTHPSSSSPAVTSPETPVKPSAPSDPSVPVSRPSAR